MKHLSLRYQAKLLSLYYFHEIYANIINCAYLNSIKAVLRAIKPRIVYQESFTVSLALPVMHTTAALQRLGCQ